MDSDRYAKLTEAQLEALRLYAELNDQKRVGRALGITQFAVRERLRAARITLSATSSWEAATAVRQYEETYPRRTCTPRQVPAATISTLSDLHTRNQPSDLVETATVREEAQPLGLWGGPDVAARQRQWRDLFLRRKGGKESDLTIVETLLAITLTLVLLAAAAFFVTMTMEAFSRHRWEVSKQAAPHPSQ